MSVCSLILSVSAHGVPITLPDDTPGSTPAEWEALLQATQANLATLVPNARLWKASKSGHDIHQDHRTIAEEGLRAFKRTTILGYEIPWNNFEFSYQWYVALDKEHVDRKVAALEKYASQQHRRYANEEYVRNLARTHGVNVNREYAEVFQVYRVIS